MSVAKPSAGLRLPESLQTQLHDFRRRVWTIKSLEAVCGALFGVVLAYLAVFALDRVIDTPAAARTAIFGVAVAICAWVPLALHRWIWRRRHLEQLARLLSRKYPSLGDQLLGVIELVRNEAEQARSRALCEAAIEQVAGDARRRDFREAVPQPRHRLWAGLAAIPVVASLMLLAVFPAAATNAWARFLAPWQPIPRYTFTKIEPLPQRLVVPHGEAATVSIPLLDASRWRPTVGTLQIGSQAPLTAELREGQYAFEVPGQIDSGWLSLHIGDARQRVRVEPMLRPELTTATAEVRLPEYLKRPELLQKDLRGGNLSIVQGSVARLSITANRNLSAAAIDGQRATPAGDTVVSSPVAIDASRKLAFEWKDEFGLQGKEPFTISITAREDEAPSLSCEDLPRQRVVLDSETLTFKVHARDDFGIKVVGMEWEALDKSAASQPARGERILAAGAFDKEQLELAGAFCAQTLEIEPQPINLRIFVEDYFPGRERTYSSPYTLYVLSAEQHAIWLTEQLSKWHRQSLEVRDREMQLHHTNQELRLLSAAELDQPDNRQRVEAQSAAERANGRRLTALTGSGEELIRQAMRNPEFGVGHLEQWAEMLNILKDISANRMPNVADLLKQSAQSPAVAANQPTKSGPAAGNIQPMPAGEGKAGESKPKPAVPAVVDAESTQGVPAKGDKPEEPSPGKSNPRLTLPVTTVMGSGKPRPKAPTPAEEKLDEAVKAQQDLLAEFDKIAEELNKILANLEGSTLVKRLKAESRRQVVVANKLTDQIGDTFGERGRGNVAVTQMQDEVGQQEALGSQKVSVIMDDIQAYFERRRFQRFKTVLEEMQQQDAVGSLRQLGDDVRTETGLSMAQAEFWADTMDRWADNLVDPACSGKCPGCKSKSSLPPSIVLEAMQILEAEVNLREDTRVAEQARPALQQDEYGQQAGKLGQLQQGLSDRVAALIVRIRDLPDGEAEFGKELALLGQVEQVMDEATGILQRPDTGSQAIAAETEAIELLLKSKKINPKGGGGGGASPGGGGGGNTTDSALALLGAGMNEKEVREERDVSQVTGETGVALPEEFRAGLDVYFNRLERERGTP